MAAALAVLAGLAWFGVGALFRSEREVLVAEITASHIRGQRVEGRMNQADDVSQLPMRTPPAPATGKALKRLGH